jgi:LDH2 family malate/lactate/ureidoglycolate dehydrogenase
MGSESGEPNDIGHFCLALDPDRFGGRAAYDSIMLDYVAALRDSPRRAAEPVLAPGDREWNAMADRDRNGIPVDPETLDFLGLS